LFICDWLGEGRVGRATAARALAAVARSTPPLSLLAREITTAPARFTALTVRFEPSAVFDRLAAALRMELGLPPAPPPTAHLSLAYPRSPIQADTVRALVVGVPLQVSYAFDALSVVDPGPDHDDWEDVEAWRVSPPTTLTPTLGEA
jgi:hypothetical protein